MKRITAIVGRNGSGKTHYVEQMRKQIASDSLRYIAFRDSYGVAVDGAYYLQLRWNQHDIDHETPTVGDLLEKSFHLTGTDTPERRQMQQRLYRDFALTPLLDKYIISLSSGELRKFQLTKTLMSQPKTLIMDNPFIGLDEATREQMRQLMVQLAQDDIEIYLVLAKSDDIPAFVNCVIDIDHDAQEQTLEAYLAERSPIPARVLSQEKEEAILQLPYKEKEYQAAEVVRMNKVSIRYGERTILRELDWVIMNGERWALSGQNGSGKSTLLSLICADNPQSYACDIALFGHQRGSGESIWDIKRHIGYVSPEMHRSYQYNIPAVKIVASGLKDSVGLYTKANAAEYEQCRWWMRIFGLEGMEDRPFLQLSSGEQRLVLLARAFVKDPELLILDEPLHGLDNINRQLVKDIINTFCRRRNKTMIMVTHYQEELPSCIDHKLWLERNE